MNLRLETAVGCMQHIVNQSPIDAALELGSIEADYKLMTGPKPWTVDDKWRVVQMLNRTMTGTLQKMGLAEVLTISAEYCAAVIALFVSPCNQFAAACWLGKYNTNDDLANFTNLPDTENNMEFVTPTRLFALVVELQGMSQTHEMARKFMQKTGRQLGIQYENKKKAEAAKSA